jgi:hypothetical protein
VFTQLAQPVRPRSEVELLREPREPLEQPGPGDDHGALELASRVLRASGVLAIWALSALPVALGLQRCTFAALLHHPCPGCGMTRAIHLLQTGDVAGSLRMHPLALPVLVAVGLVALSTAWTTVDTGSPIPFYRSRLGRAALVLAIAVYAAALLLWIARWFGFFGGPVPVD